MKISRNKIAVLTPVYNEAKHLGAFLNQLKSTGLHILLVDDGSKDASYTIAQQCGVQILKFSVNHGKGFAIREGIDQLMRSGFEWIIMMDSDGQHSPDDIPAFIRMAQTGSYGLINGNRMSKPKGMPLLRRLTNHLMSGVMSLLTGQRIQDSQCGFKMLSTTFLKDCRLESNHYEIEDELILKAAKRGQKIGFVPIDSSYGNEKSHIHPWRDTLRFIRFVLKSKRLACVTFLLLTLLVYPARAQDFLELKEGSRESLQTQNISIEVYLPSGIHFEKRYPMVLMMDPSGDGKVMVPVWKSICERYKWVLISSNDHRNGLSYDRLIPWMKATIYVAAARYPVNPSRVIATGFSGGGMTAHALAMELPEVKAAIVNTGVIQSAFKVESKYPDGKIVAFLASQQDGLYPTMKNDLRFLKSMNWETKWIEFAEGHQFAPLSVYEEAAAWVHALLNP